MTKTHVFYGSTLALGLWLIASPTRILETAHAFDGADEKPAAPVVFQAAGPTVASIQSMVDAFRATLGGVNNGNAPGPLAEGRREINWDGGGSTATSVVATPFDGFLIGRGARFTTGGTGFVQAPVDGLATLFTQPAYAEIFTAFSPVRLFSPIDSNVTTARFFIPGGSGLEAITTGFGAIFTDVDRDEHPQGYATFGKRTRGTRMSFYGVDGTLLYTADAPASPGEGSLSFLGVVFTDARVASVRIKTGNAVPGQEDNGKRDVVMMDDFLYGEPRALDAGQQVQVPEGK